MHILFLAEKFACRHPHVALFQLCVHHLSAWECVEKQSFKLGERIGENTQGLGEIGAARNEDFVEVLDFSLKSFCDLCGGQWREGRDVQYQFLKMGA
jgi:hypothetical protein